MSFRIILLAGLSMLSLVVYLNLPPFIVGIEKTLLAFFPVLFMVLALIAGAKGK